MTQQPLYPDDIIAIVASLTQTITNDVNLQTIFCPPTNLNQQIQVIDTKWRIEEFRLFQLNLTVDDRNPVGDMISVGRDTIYRNVDAFCERIMESIRDTEAEIVRDNLHLCLCSAASR